jgi:hypothetical protein
LGAGAGAGAAPHSPSEIDAARGAANAPSSQPLPPLAGSPARRSRPRKAPAGAVPLGLMQQALGQKGKGKSGLGAILSAVA